MPRQASPKPMSSLSLPEQQAKAKVQLSRLQTQITSKTEELTGLTVGAQDARERLSQLDHDYAVRKDELVEEYETKRRTLESELAATRAEFDEQLSTDKEQQAELLLGLETLRSAAADAREATKRANYERDGAIMAADGAHEELDATKALTEQHERRNTELQEANAGLTTNLAELQTTERQAIAYREELRGKIGTLESTFTTKKADFERQLGILNAEAIDLTEKRIQWEHDVEMTERELVRRERDLSARDQNMRIRERKVIMSEEKIRQNAGLLEL